jgi:hypothetical protein
VSDSLAAGQGQEGGLTMHAVLIVGVASGRAVPLRILVELNIAFVKKGNLFPHSSNQKKAIDLTKRCR